MRYSTSILFAALLSTAPSFAQQFQDGLLVPFTSGLPACASQCGFLHDVQGACTPPITTTADRTCFCNDARLSAWRTMGAAGVSQTCGPTSCTSASDLQAVSDWYNSVCGASSGSGGAPTTTARAGSATNAGSSGSGGSSRSNSGGGGGGGGWVQTHTKWLIMAIVLVIGLGLLWVGAWFLRRRYLRKKEREIEMHPPVSWGPQQAHNYGDGTSNAAVVSGGAGGAGGHHKEYNARDSTAEGKRLTKGKMGWFKAS